jgi:hypothetical protein
MRALRVLLIGTSLERAGALVSHLARWQCQYEFANSTKEAMRLLSEHIFDLVLDATHREKGSPLSSFRAVLERTTTTLLYSYAVEDGCWWLLGLDRGKPCLWDAPALHPSELFAVLDAILEELAAGRPALPRISRELSSSERLLRAPDQTAKQSGATRASRPNSLLAEGRRREVA